MIVFEGLTISFRLTTLTYAWKQEQTKNHLDHRIKPREPSVIELTLARLVNKQSVVLDLPRVAIPGKVLATETVSVEIVSFIMFFYPVGRTKALVFFQKSWTTSKSCDVAVNTLSCFISGLQSRTITSRYQPLLSCIGKICELWRAGKHGHQHLAFQKDTLILLGRDLGWGEVKPL